MSRVARAWRAASPRESSPRRPLAANRNAIGERDRSRRTSPSRASTRSVEVRERKLRDGVALHHRRRIEAKLPRTFRALRRSCRARYHKNFAGVNLLSRYKVPHGALLKHFLARISSHLNVARRELARRSRRAVQFSARSGSLRRRSNYAAHFGSTIVEWPRAAPGNASRIDALGYGIPRQRSDDRGATRRKAPSGRGMRRSRVRASARSGGTEPRWEPHCPRLRCLTLRVARRLRCAAWSLWRRRSGDRDRRTADGVRLALRLRWLQHTHRRDHGIGSGD